MEPHQHEKRPRRDPKHRDRMVEGVTILLVCVPLVLAIVGFVIWQLL